MQNIQLDLSRLDGWKADRITRELKLIARRCRGDLDAFENCLETFIKVQFPDESQPRSLALWFVHQYELSKQQVKMRELDRDAHGLPKRNKRIKKPLPDTQTAELFKP